SLDLSGVRLACAAHGPRALSPRTRREEALEAAWLDRPRRVQTRGLPAGGPPELPRARRMVARDRGRDLLDGRPHPRLEDRAGPERTRKVGQGPARLLQRGLDPEAIRRRAGPPPRAVRARRVGSRRTQEGRATHPGADEDA